MPSISVIIPVYNGVETLIRPLSSLCRQSLKDIEVIVVDDCSDDGSLVWAEEYLCGKNLSHKLLSQDFRKGVSSARNLGLIKANGECVLFLDADDYLEDTCLQKLYSLFHEDGNVDAGFCGFKRVDVSGKVIQPYQPGKKYLDSPVPGKEVLSLLWRKKIDIHMTSFMVRRSFLLAEGINFYEGCIYREDFEFFSKTLYAARKIASFPEELSNYVVYEASTTGRKGFMDRAAIHELSVFLRLAKMLSESSMDRELILLIEKFIIHGYVEVLSRLLKTGKRDCFKKMMKSRRVRNALKLARKKEILISKPEYFFKLLPMYVKSFFAVS